MNHTLAPSHLHPTLFRGAYTPHAARWQSIKALCHPRRLNCYMENIRASFGVSFPDAAQWPLGKPVVGSL